MKKIIKRNKMRTFSKHLLVISLVNICFLFFIAGLQGILEYYTGEEATSGGVNISTAIGAALITSIAMDSNKFVKWLNK